MPPVLSGGAEPLQSGRVTPAPPGAPSLAEIIALLLPAIPTPPVPPPAPRAAGEEEKQRWPLRTSCQHCAAASPASVGTPQQAQPLQHLPGGSWFMPGALGALT